MKGAAVSSNSLKLSKLRRLRTLLGLQSHSVTPVIDFSLLTKARVYVTNSVLNRTVRRVKSFKSNKDRK